MTSKGKATRPETNAAQSNHKPSTTDASFKGWVNVDLSPNDKEQFVEWQAHEDWGGIMNVHMTRGITYSVKYDADNECYLAKAFHADKEHVSGGYAVTMRARDGVTAFARCVYVVECVLPVDWSAHAVKQKRQDW